MKIGDGKFMMVKTAATTHDRMILDYMEKNHSGKCEWNHGKICDGFCNNCPFDYYRSMEKMRAAGTYKPDYSRQEPYKAVCGDYESMILARQDFE